MGDITWKPRPSLTTGTFFHFKSCNEIRWSASFHCPFECTSAVQCSVWRVYSDVSFSFGTAWETGRLATTSQLRHLGALSWDLKWWVNSPAERELRCPERSRSREQRLTVGCRGPYISYMDYSMTITYVLGMFTCRWMSF